MTTLFWKKVGLSFGRAFVGAFVLLVPGLLAAPNLDIARALAVSALIAAVAAGLRAVQALFTTAETP